MLVTLMITTPAVAQNTHTYSITGLVVTPTVGAFSQVITGVNWRDDVIDPNNPQATCESTGSVALPAPTPGQPYAYSWSVTQTQAVNWLKTVITGAALTAEKAQCDQSIANQELPNQPVVIILPWVGQ